MLFRATRAALGALIFMLAPVAVVSADPLPAASPTPAPEIGRVSTSDRHDEPIGRTTRATYVVDRVHIETRGERTVADALADVPGVELYRYGAFGAQSIIFTRGSSTTGVLILLDGVPVTPGSNEQLDLGTLSTVGVRRIEIVEGSGSTLYGANAVGGVINIITDIPRGTYLEASAGSLRDRDLRLGTGNGRLGVSFERHLAENDYSYPAAGEPGSALYPAGSRNNADAEQTAARVAYDINLGSNFSARLRLGNEQIHLGVPGSLTFGTDAFARENISRADAHIEITHTGTNSATTLTLFGLHQNLDYVDPSAAIENPTIDGRTQIALRNVTQAGPSTLMLGIDIARESAVLANIGTYDANGNLGGYATTGQTQSEAALYAQDQLTLHDGVQINAGVRGEIDAPFGSAATPSLGVGIPLGTVRLVINGGTAFRVPTIVDRYYPGFANPALKPERSKDTDITLAARALFGGASFGYFTRDATNLIQIDSDSIGHNVAQSSLRGFIATLRTRPFHGAVANISLTDTYRAQNLSPGSPQSRLFFTPVFVTKLGIERALGAGNSVVGAQANIYGPHNESGGFNPDGQTTVDVYVRDRIARDGFLSVRARNIGNERYAPLLGYPAPGRTFEVELSTR